ncbi:MAG TPA: alanine--tRNA ligase [Blastocatellia bacterium]|jgi:alanyl-tRNA synthetase|nr:alanine--tRNA ligase [Blastocatellia bacterium]
MTGNEVRTTFLNYFARNGHKIVKSSPLLPAHDPTLLFTNAGMNQFKDVFLGAEKRDYKRATSSQKVVRAGGKHNDLDEVGKTARHHTFFEMLGNFSFGDYFKEDAIRFAWDLLVNEWKLDPERMWFTVFEGDDEVPADDEAAALWVKVGAKPERIVRFGRKDNFWQMAETGPCGPNSEVNYYLGPHPEDPNFNKREYVNGPGDETVEIWNLVFMQYNRIEEAPGKYRLEPLPAPSVDTGAGLERVTAVLQGVKSAYETDLIRPIIDFTAKLAGKKYVYDDSEDSISMRVIADHARATAFLIADGVFPGNDKRGYVLRKIMRRAIWHGNKLGFKDVFFAKVADFVVDQFGDAYPELRETRGVIERVVTIEERLYGSTVSAGMNVLEDVMKKTAGKVISGADVFKLYDTYGMRDDLVEYVAAQRGFTLDHRGFKAELEKQQQRARESMKGGAAKIVNPVYQKIAQRGRTEFSGYAGTELSGTKVAALVRNGELVDEIVAGDEAEVVLDRTPFYAESGGQVGDVGLLESEDARLLVTDAYSPTSGVTVHRVTVEQGALKTGDAINAHVDAEKRARTMANHTATHLLHAALREVLGPHVKQAGSLVAPDRLRFDFTHFAPLTQEEIAEIERLVNDQTLKNTPVSKEEKTLDEALAGGAMALFGEKYTDRVRVVSVPGFSTELCGGTHVNATGDIGVFKIVSDASIASGTRRIEAVTGKNAYERFALSESLLAEAASRLNTAPRSLPVEVERLQSQLRDQQKEIERLKLKLAQGGGAAADQVTEVNGLKVLVRKVEGLGKDGRRQLADSLTRKVAPGVVVLGDVDNGKASILVMVSADATKKVQAGKVIKELPGARGGGKPDLAEGGVETDKLDEALKAAPQVIEKMLAS